MKKNIILLGTLIISSIAYSQVGINTDQPKATLDIKASPTSTTKIDGLIAPRLTGNELQAKDALYEDDQDATIIYATAPVTTITDKTTNVTSIGYYYFDKTQGTNGRWMKIASPSNLTDYKEPWNVQGSTTPATLNSDAIYQNNAVAVKKQNGILGADLDVLGAIRGGNALVYSSGTTPVVVGANSIAVGEGSAATGANSGVFGSNNLAAGDYSFATGQNNTTKGLYSIVGGKGNVVGTGLVTTSGYISTVFGENNKVNHILSFVNGYGNSLEDADGQAGTNFVAGDANKITGNSSWNFISGRLNTISNSQSFATGLGNNVSGQFAFAAGLGLISASKSELALGRYNLNFTNSFFTLGNGFNASNRSNLIAAIVDQTNATTVKDAWVAIGSNTAIPDRQNNTIKLRVYGGIQTAASTYADYVFEDYFNGNSSINPNYKFNTLYSVEKFVKQNHHLPGVTSIKNLEKTSDGYSFDLTSLSTQTLEKVEELYLHTIEQQKQIDELKALVKTQQEQINQLLKK